MLCVAFLKSGPGGAERKVVIKCIPKPQNIYNHRKIIWQTCGMSEKVQVEVGNCFDKLFNPLQLRIVLYILCFIYCIGEAFIKKKHFLIDIRQGQGGDPPPLYKSEK